MSQTGLSLPHREQEWYGARLEEFRALTTSLQTQKIREMHTLLLAAHLTKTNKPTDASGRVISSDAVAAPILDHEGLTVLAIFVRVCGLANAQSFLADYQASTKSRKHLAVALVKEAFRYATAPAVHLAGPAPVDNTITLADIRREKEAEAAAAAEALRIATFVPPALTPHMTMAYEMGMAAESLRLSADLVDQELLESGRKLAIKFRWNRIFVLLAQQVTLIHEQHLEKRIARHINRVMDLEERAAEYEKLWHCPMPKDEGDAAVLKWKRARDTDSWATINEMTHGVNASYDRCAVKALMIAGVHILMRKWWKQAPKTAPRVNKHVRLTTAEKAIKHNEVVKQLLPAYLVARDIATFTKPVETIQTIRLGNLREARGDAQVRDLHKDVRAFVERNGGVIAVERGAVFTPLHRATRQTQGYCFVKLVSPANARLFLDCIAALEHAMLVDSHTGEEREVFPELAASDRKTKEEMETEKAKVAAEKRAAASVDSVSAAIKAVMRGPGGELKPICLADIKREKKSAAEQALKDTIAAAFPSLNSCTSNSASAKHYEVSFAAAAAKPLPEKVVVVNPFEVKVGGVEYALIAAPTTDIGRAQMALRQAVADSVAAEERRKVRAARVEMVVGENGWMVEKAVDASFQETFKARLAEAARKK